MDETKKDWFRRVFGGWFGSQDALESETAPAPAPAKPVSEGAPPLRGDGESAPDLVKPSPVAMAVSKKLAALKNAMEFDDALKSRLNKIRSADDLLLYSYEVLFRKFLDLQEIGFLSGESNLVLDALHRKFDSILAGNDASARSKEAAEHSKVKEELAALREQFAALKAKSVKGGVISERELQLEEEAEYLKRRVRELKSEVEVVRKKQKALSSAMDMASSLMAKNSLLNSRLSNQTKVLQTLISKKPKEKDLLARIEELRTENDELKRLLEQREGTMTRLRDGLVADGSSNEALDGLFDSNAALREQLAEKDAKIEGLFIAQPNPDVTETILQLSDENFQLKTLLETEQAVKDNALDQQNGPMDHEHVTEILKLENQRLQAALSAKEEQVKALKSNPAQRSMMRAMMRLKDENKQLLKVSDARNRMCEELEAEKKQLILQARKAEDLGKEILVLRGKLETSGQTVKSMQKAVAQHQSLKKEYSVIVSKYDAAQLEILNMKKRLSRITAEYDILVKEYENIFGGSLKV